MADAAEALLRGAQLHFPLTAQNRAPVLMIRYRHSALHAHPRALNRLVRFASKQLLQKGHVPSRAKTAPWRAHVAAPGRTTVDTLDEPN
jgi:hypothetical protein